jgi:hypothetical protein
MRGRAVVVVPALGLLALAGAACSNGSGHPASSTATSRGGTQATRVPVPGPGTSTTMSTAPATTATAPTTATTQPSTASGAPPTLGLASAFGPSAAGFGQVRPSEISLGGDPTGMVNGISWQSWGGAQATGTGTGTYVGPGQTAAQGSPEPADVVASGLGTCGGAPAYRQVTWYFPTKGQTSSTTTVSTVDACTGP